MTQARNIADASTTAPKREYHAPNLQDLGSVTDMTLTNINPVPHAVGLDGGTEPVFYNS